MKSRKAINFDLDTANLKKYYPQKNYRQAYRDIKDFMVNNGFKHRQWSGYISIHKINDYDVKKITQNLTKKFVWLKKCVNRFDVTDIGKTHDLTHIIKGKPKANVKSKSVDKTVSSKADKGFSIEKLRSEAKKAHLRAQSKTVEKKQEHEL